MIIGDLNEFSSGQEKYSKELENLTRFNKFNNVFNKNNLLDISNIRLPYTGWNSRTNINAIFDRLDRSWPIHHY